MIKDDFNAFLKSVSGIAAIVSSRIYPKMRPQDSDLPAIVHTVSGEQNIKDIAGSVMYTITFFTVECYAIGYRSAATLAAAVKAGMETSTSYWWNAELNGENDSYDQETNEDSVTLSYAITH